MEFPLALTVLWFYFVTAHEQNKNELANFQTYKGGQKSLVTKKKYLPYYHITAPMGWLNNPAGFIYFQHQYHVFYQYYPYNGYWGHLHWGHSVSDNLVNWRHLPPAIAPGEGHEKHGCMAGSALVQNNYITVFYTASFTVNNRTVYNQNIAISSDGFFFQKYLYNPIIGEPPYMMNEMRNPRVWKHWNSWYMLVGAKDERQLGALLLYTSFDMFNWRFNGTVAQSYGDMGYMWEMPDFFELDGSHVLILSARGVQVDGYRHRNLFQTGYMVGKFDYSTLRFTDDFEISTATFNEIDYGHDFYAAQTMQARDGRRLLVGWLGSWESPFDESTGGWASMLTVVRQLTLSSEGRLLIKPVEELALLRQDVLEEAWYVPGEWFHAGSKSFELLVNSSVGANEIVLSLEWRTAAFIIEYSARKGMISINRGGEDGLRRADWLPKQDLVHLRLFVDNSSVELFCGEGEVVFTSRIYPRRGIRVRIGGDTPVHVIQYRLRRSISHRNLKHKYT